jgi:hypothetical protein
MGRLKRLTEENWEEQAKEYLVSLKAEWLYKIIIMIISLAGAFKVDQINRVNKEIL